VPDVRILVVDDSAVVRRFLKMLLEQHDTHWKVCEEAVNGREAVEKFEHARPDVVILDFQMPEMNGLDAARELKHQSPEVPILMYTMHTSPYLSREARKIGIEGTCPKSDIRCVTQAVTSLLNHQSYFRD
jgi:DNA-binding NarL/FixJ family response regulator